MKPRVFVGSSTEGFDVACAIQANLQWSFEVTLWAQGQFAPSQYPMETLLQALEGNDFGVFVLSADDVVRMGRRELLAARDNVIFELGLFVGRLGRERSFIVAPRGVPDFHLPSDLVGITPATYPLDRSDRNLNAALGPACTELSGVMKRLGVRGDHTGGAKPSQYFMKLRLAVGAPTDVVSGIAKQMIALGMTGGRQSATMRPEGQLITFEPVFKNHIPKGDLRRLAEKAGFTVLELRGPDN